VLLLVFAGAPLFSIAVAELLLAIIALLWLILVIRGPSMFAPSSDDAPKTDVPSMSGSAAPK